MVTEGNRWSEKLHNFMTHIKTKHIFNVKSNSTPWLLSAHTQQETWNSFLSFCHVVHRLTQNRKMRSHIMWADLTCRLVSVLPFSWRWSSNKPLSVDKTELVSSAKSLFWGWKWWEFKMESQEELNFLHVLQLFPRFSSHKPINK